MKKYFLPGVILLFLIAPIIGPVQAPESNIIRFMVLEKVDLFVDGSAAPVLIDLTEDFDHIMRFVWNLVWTDNDIDYDIFGTLAVALTNGTEVLYNGTEQLDPIKAIKDFGSVSYDVRIDSDDKNPKTNHLYSRLSFWKFVDQADGLAHHHHPIQFRVNDDITGACDDFFVLVEGYKLVVPFTPAKQYPINPFTYFNNWALWAFTQPLVWLMIILGMVIIIFVFRNLMR